MKFGTFFAYWEHNWGGDYLGYIKKVKKLGFDALEISPPAMLNWSDAQLEELKAVSKDLDILISSNMGPPKDKDVASKDPAVRKAGIEFTTNCMKVMDKIDSRNLGGVIHTYWPCDFEDLDKEAIWARGVESTKKLGAVAQDLGITISLEVVNRFESNILNSCEEGLQYCKQVGMDSVKMLLDTFHMNIEEDNIADAIRAAGDYLGYLHVGESNRKVPGKGHLPWFEIGEALREINFDSNIIMEPFIKMGGQIGEDIKVWRDLSNGADVATMDKEIAESVVFLRKAFVG
jgi:D-psicose/D-tagatose/L-ribulose 3-epimerase